MAQKKLVEKTRQEGRSVRENILAAAVQLFAEYGYHAAPLRDIARITGIQAASIYYHYANKEALLVEIMETHMRQLNANLERILHEQRDPLIRLHQAITNHIRYIPPIRASFLSSILRFDLLKVIIVVTSFRCAIIMSHFFKTCSETAWNGASSA